MAIAKELALDQQQIDTILLTEWNMRIATLGPGTQINVTPMWFGWAGGKIYYSLWPVAFLLFIR